MIMIDNAALDRRQLKTREAIKSSFMQMMLETNFQKINMTGIAVHANVGRSTMYEHYKNKNELFRDVLRYPMTALASTIGSFTIPHNLNWWLTHFREKHALARVLLHLPARNEMIGALRDAIIYRFDIIEMQNRSGVPNTLIASQIAAAQFEILEPWILGKTPLTIDVIAKAIYDSGNAIANAYLRPRNLLD